MNGREATFRNDRERKGEEKRGEERRGEERRGERGRENMNNEYICEASETGETGEVSHGKARERSERKRCEDDDECSVQPTAAHLSKEIRGHSLP